MTEISIEKWGLRFTASPMGTRTKGTQVNVYRLSDGHHVGQKLYGVDFSIVTEELVDGAATVWIEDKLGVPEPPKTSCYACNVELTPDGNRDTDYQFANALWVDFDGGYGMFVDDIDSERPSKHTPYKDQKRDRAVICHDCAHELCATVPWIERLLNPHNSHSHKTSYHEEHPDHYGWDYDRRNAD